MRFDFLKYDRDTLGGLLLQLLLAFSALGVIALLFFYIYLPNITNHDRTMTVPAMEGKSIDQLDDFLAERSLRYGLQDSAYSSKYPAHTILDQYPAAGAKVKVGREILVSVNRVSPPTVTVPNAIDGSVVNAEAVLRSNQLKRGKIIYVRGLFPVVIEMKCEGRTLTPGERIPMGSTVDLVVTDGEGPSHEAPDTVASAVREMK
jgi:beta-lactam-binding protein with PASTA domain